MARLEFDVSMDRELLANGFVRDADDEENLISKWEVDDSGVCALVLSKHDYGYYVLCKNDEYYNLGSSNNAKDIIAVRDALKALW